MADRIAVVTGVSKGLGESLATALLACGFAVVGIGRSSARRLDGRDFRLVHADLRDTRGLASTLATLFDELALARPAAIAVINNAAAAGPAATIGALDASEVDEALDVNLNAPVLVADAFVRAFGGLPGDRRLLNISSGAAAHPIPGIGIYCVAKAGIEMLTRIVAAESGSHGVVAISVRPGVIDTPMQAFARSQPRGRMPSVDMFLGFHASGQLVPPDVTASRIVERLVVAPVESGRTYDDTEL